MNTHKKQTKFISAVTGIAVLTAATAFAALPDEASAKWLNWTRPAVTQTEVEASQTQSAASNVAPEAKPVINGDLEIAPDAPEKALSSIITVGAEPAANNDKPVIELEDTASKAGVIGTVVSSKVVIGSSRTPYHNIDVGPGVEGLDYAKAIKWQQNVDAGYERWRLDPMQVARKEGKNYGFTDKDTFTIVKRLEKSSLSRHGEIHVKVNHNDKEYTMILVKPFGGGDAIWTTYKVIGQYKPVPPVETEGKTIFATDKFNGWKWYNNRYFKDMAFATIVNYDAQLKQDSRIPENVLNRVKDVDYNKKVVLFAYLGTAPTGGYGVGIEKVTMNANKMTVTVHTRSPQPGAPVTLAMTQPSDYLVIDRAIVDIWGGVDITFIDQKGQVLSKNKLTIIHRS